MLLGVALVSVGAVAVWGASGLRAGDTDEYAITAIGPDGALFDTRARVANATALAALRVAAEDAGHALTLEEYPGMGTYVRAIGEHVADGPYGWIYEVHRDGAWISGDRSAAHYPLQKGDALRWTWTRA